MNREGLGMGGYEEDPEQFKAERRETPVLSAKMQLIQVLKREGSELLQRPRFANLEEDFDLLADTISNNADRDLTTLTSEQVSELEGMISDAIDGENYSVKTGFQSGVMTELGKKIRAAKWD